MPLAKLGTNIEVRHWGTQYCEVALVVTFAEQEEGNDSQKPKSHVLSGLVDAAPT